MAASSWEAEQQRLAAQMASIQTRMDSEVAQLRSQLECTVGKYTTAEVQHTATQADSVDQLAHATEWSSSLRATKLSFSLRLVLEDSIKIRILGIGNLRADCVKFVIAVIWFIVCCDNGRSHQREDASDMHGDAGNLCLCRR